MTVSNRHLFIVFLLNLSMAYSQVTTTSTLFTTKKDDPDSVEYVTVGSIMPYKVTPFNWGSLAAYMNPSIFKWWLNGNTTGYELLQSDGITPLTLLPPPNHAYYPDSGISIRWIKTGKYTIRVNEKSMPKENFTMCDQGSDIQTLDVLVADRPTVAWNGPTLKGGCSLDSTVQQIPVLLSGSGQITITYTLAFTPQNGTVSTNTNQTVIFAVARNDTTTAGFIQISTPNGNFGKYEITITGITDKVATKCGISPLPNDYPADKYTVLILPALETSPIRFVKEIP